MIYDVFFLSNYIILQDLLLPMSRNEDNDDFDPKYAYKHIFYLIYLCIISSLTSDVGPCFSFHGWKTRIITGGMPPQNTSNKIGENDKINLCLF